MTDAEVFLQAWHARHAGASSIVFGPGRTADGRDTYDHLAAEALGARRVLDVACGDGTLLTRVHQVAPDAERIGVDLSPDELAMAARADPGATLYQARAQALPLPDDHVDCVLSHMALMLMDDVDQVVAELHRVLRPGGRLAVVVGHGVNDALRGVLSRGWEGESDRPAPPRLGDPRTHDADGLRTLLGPLGEVGVEPLTLALEVPRTELATWLHHAFYGTESMDDASLAQAIAEAPDPLPAAFELWLARVDDVGRT
jgi:SAM-dependent methyltransferase